MVLGDEALLAIESFIVGAGPEMRSRCLRRSRSSETSSMSRSSVGDAIREIGRLRRRYGPGRWRKLKGKALIQLSDGTVCHAEVHWYEAAGVGRQELKIKRVYWDEP
jgi:hypothetical protein